MSNNLQVGDQIEFEDFPGGLRRKGILEERLHKKGWRILTLDGKTWAWRDDDMIFKTNSEEI